jgi:hypothetical protein
VDQSDERIAVSRRHSLKLGALAMGAISAPACAAAQAGSAVLSQAAAAVPPFRTRIAFDDPLWNRDTYARLDGEVDISKQKVSRITGKVYGVRDNEKVRHLFDMDGFSVVRTIRTEDGNWRRLLKEVVFYRDAETGRIMETWDNPYTNETVKVVPIANDPFNYDIKDTQPEGPSYGGLNAVKPEPRPFLLNWTDAGDKLILNTGIDLFYPAAMQPEKWPRESAGSWNRVSEHFIFFLDKADIENPAITAIPVTGSWSRLTPWLPWMLMGQASGCINYFCHFATVKGGIADLPAELVAAARAIDPGYLEAPLEDYGPSLSSLENYIRQQQPAPVPEGWTAPAAPDAPPLPPFMRQPE